MKLTFGQINGFLEKPPASVRVVLIYGPDAGLVSERATALAKKIVDVIDDPFRVALLTGSSLGDDGERLFDEMAAQAFGGGRRLVRLQHAVESNAKPLGKLLEELPLGDSFLLIEAGDLEKRSKLRSLCEGAAPEVCAVPCYVEDGAARTRSIGDVLRAEGLKVQKELLSLLSDILPPDRLAMRSELEKLALYCKGAESGEVTLADVEAVVANAGGAEIDEMVFLAASGERKKAGVLLERLFAEQTSCVAILRATQRHFIRLQQTRSMVDAGKSAREAVDSLKPKVFWKFVTPLVEQTQRWEASKIEKVLKILYEAEAAVKKTGTPDTTLTAHVIFQISG